MFSRGRARWFESAPGYPPSPFVIKLNQREVLSIENENASLKSSDGESMISCSNNMDCDMDYDMDLVSGEEVVEDDDRKAPYNPSAPQSVAVRSSCKESNGNWLRARASYAACQPRRRSLQGHLVEGAAGQCGGRRGSVVVSSPSGRERLSWVQFEG